MLIIAQIDSSRFQSGRGLERRGLLSTVCSCLRSHLSRFFATSALLRRCGAAYRNFVLPEEPRFDRLRSWHEACQRRPSVRATLADESKLVANYAGYADNTATSAVAKSVRGG